MPKEAPTFCHCSLRPYELPLLSSQDPTALDRTTRRVFPCLHDVSCRDGTCHHDGILPPSRLGRAALICLFCNAYTLFASIYSTNVSLTTLPGRSWARMKVPLRSLAHTGSRACQFYPEDVRTIGVIRMARLIPFFPRLGKALSIFSFDQRPNCPAEPSSKGTRCDCT